LQCLFNKLYQVSFKVNYKFCDALNVMMHDVIRDYAGKEKGIANIMKRITRSSRSHRRQ